MLVAYWGAKRLNLHHRGFFKGEVSWGSFISFVKNDEIRHSISSQIISE